MLNFLVRRLGSGALSLLVIAALVFLLLKALPGAFRHRKKPTT